MRRAFPSRSNSAATPPVSATTAANTHANRRASTNDAGTVRFNITELNEALPIPQPPAYSPIPRYSAPSQPPPRSNLRQPHNSAGILTTEPIDPRGPTRARSRTEDPLMILQRYDRMSLEVHGDRADSFAVCFLIDDSPSMISLWNQARGESFPLNHTDVLTWVEQRPSKASRTSQSSTIEMGSICSSSTPMKSYPIVQAPVKWKHCSRLSYLTEARLLLFGLMTSCGLISMIAKTRKRTEHNCPNPKSSL